MSQLNLINVEKTNTMFFSRKVSNAQEMFEECLKLNSWNGFVVSPLLNLDLKTWDKLLFTLTLPKSELYTSGTRKICRLHQTSFLSFSQSLNKFLDCGASLSRPVRFDLCPRNPGVTVSLGRRAMRVSRSHGLRCDFSTNKLAISISNMSLYTRNITSC